MLKGIDFQIEYYKLKTGLSFVDSFLDYCDENGLDPEEIINDLGKPLIEKIKVEFINRKMVKNETKAFSISIDFFCNK